MAEAARKLTTDGRLVRSERTRASVVDALIALLEEGDVRPTAPRIAERAGVSLRSVFHYFEDLEQLFAVVADRQLEQVFRVLRPIAPDAPLGTRVSSFAAQRAQIFEMTSAVRRAAELAEPFSPEIAARLAWARRVARSEVERVFAEELRALEPFEGINLLEALAAASSWSAWETFRRHQGLAAEDAQRVLVGTLQALLTVSAGVRPLHHVAVDRLPNCLES